MPSTEYTIERECALINVREATGWFRLTYRREWIPELNCWRDTLVRQERLGWR